MNVRNIFLFFLMVSFLGLFSCEEEEIFSKDVKVFVNTQFAPIDTLKTDIVVSGMEVSGNVGFKFPVRINREIGEDVYVNLQIDESQVAAFNKKMGVSFKNLSMENCKFSHQENLLIKAGELMSTDSVCVELNNVEGLKGSYLLPIRISGIQSKDKGVKVSDNLNTVYCIYTITVNNIDPDNSDLSGTPIDRTDWSIDTNGRNAVKILDGDVNTFYEPSRGILTVDMKESHILKGLLITPYSYYGNLRFNPTKVTVYTSKDGENWENHMYGEKEKPTSLKDIFKIKFYNSVEARFIKLRLEGGSDGYNGLSELNALE